MFIVTQKGELVNTRNCGRIYMDVNRRGDQPDSPLIHASVCLTHHRDSSSSYGTYYSLGYYDTIKEAERELGLIGLALQRKENLYGMTPRKFPE